MTPQYLLYQVQPHEHLPTGMRPVAWTIVWRVWHGAHIDLVWPDGRRD